MSRSLSSLLAVSVAAVQLAAAPVHAAEKTKAAAAPAAAGKPAGYEPGEKWRVTTSMSAMGMTMPGMTNEVCAPQGSDGSERMDMDKNCRITDQKRVGNKQTMHIVCTGKNAMEGDMEMENLGPDHYRGRMNARTADGEMTMNYEGRKLPGECDAGEMKRKMNAMLAKHDAEMAKVCREGAKNLQYGLFAGADAQCKDPKDKETFCSSAGSHKGFGALSQQERWTRKSGVKGQMMALTDSAKFCGFAAEGKRKELCSSAEGKGAWVFLANECPVIADPLAQRECAGRDFTTPVAPKYVDFCNAYGKDRSLSDASGAGDGASDGAASGAAAPDGAGTTEGENGEPQKESVGDKAKKGLKKLKGLFGN